ncbi:SAM-dependent methyltransferase [Streptomyces sp. NPDC017405]|uniref:SAM-dependent methyltransferase n=1 Tax=unclassified Streptomyces TaxID=2593676 RepID=UPI003792979F
MQDHQGASHEDQTPTPDDVARMYDNSSALLSEVMGGNIHLGYWDGDDDTRSVAEATDALTGMVADRLALSPGMRVLDIGCGTGRPAVYVAGTYDVHVTGITISPQQVELALARPEVGEGPGRVAFECADGMALPFPDGRFDAVYAIESFLHMDDRAKAIAEAARVLRPGGMLVMANPYVEGELTEAEAEIVAANRELFQIPPVGSADDYVGHLRDAGLEVTEVLDIGENVRRSHAVAADTVRRAGDGHDGAFRQQLSEVADIIERFGALQQVGYGLIAARTAAAR